MCGRSDLNNENMEMLVNSFEAVNMVTDNANHTFAYMHACTSFSYCTSGIYRYYSSATQHFSYIK